MHEHGLRFLTLILSVLLLAGCGNPTAGQPETLEAAPMQSAASDSETSTDAPASFLPASEAPQISGLTFLEETPLDYTQCFRLYRYENGYTLIDIADEGQFLVIPEGGNIPDNLGDITVLQQPLDKIYLAATSAMSLFTAVDAESAIRLTSVRASGWYIPKAVAAMERGDILFAGKYSEPDYERLIEEDCNLALESTMIYHAPKVQEMIEDLGIPVLVDRSSYEPHPLGRTEWVKLYAVLTGKEAAAEQFFDTQSAVIQKLENFEPTGKTVAFFYMNTDGSAVIRKATDYIPKMIALAGGEYVFQDLQTDQSSTSFPISMEDFYAGAVDADILIYNASIDGSLESIDALLAQNPLFADFKAVKDGQVWCAGQSYYQSTDTIGEMIWDIHLVLTGGSEQDMKFITRVS